MNILPILATLAVRANATANDTIANISTFRLDNITGSWGGWTDNQTGAPDWGFMLWNIVSVYPDAVGYIAWFVLFSIPFVMMWLAHADMVPSAIVGIFFGLYVFMFLSDQVKMIGIAMMVLAMVTIVWSMWLKRG